MDLVARGLGLIAYVHELLVAFLLTAFVCLAARSFALLALVPGGRLVLAKRFLAGVAWLALGTLYGLFVLQALVVGPLAIAIAVALVLATVANLHWRHHRREQPCRPGLVDALAQAVAVLALLLIAAITLMRVGFLALTEDRPVLVVELTGETGTLPVRWAAPDQPLREERLVTHHVVFRTLDGLAVSDAWVYGDQVAVKGQVLRLPPLLNAAGVPNLFELAFAHNGWASAERHNAMPHVALKLPRIGPLAVHPWLRGLQQWVLARLEGGACSVRAVSTESTWFALVDAAGKPLQRRYTLVVTPGGLTTGERNGASGAPD